LTRILRIANRLNRSTVLKHTAGAGLLIGIAAALLGVLIRHTETSFADGLRYIRQAERIDAAGLGDGAKEGTDHPLHPLLIATAHRLLGGDGPASWQRAALWLSFACTVLLVAPIYMITIELFDRRAAWLACLLVMINPLSSYIVVNVLSESTFLLPWTFGVWAAIRFLHAGRLRFLVLAIGFGALAYLTRPEGLLLSCALLASLLASAVFRATRLDWRQWRRLVGCLLGGVMLLAGPYIALRGGLGTKPGIARVLGLAPRSNRLALERERPLEPDQPLIETYKLASVRMLKVMRAAVTPTLLPFALLGVLLWARRGSHGRAAMFLAMVLAASAVALVRLHATGGYCTTRHGLIPGMLLSLAAAGGLGFVSGKLVVPGRWLGIAYERVGIPAPLCCVLMMVMLIMANGTRGMEFRSGGPFAVYHATASWLSGNATGGEKVLDMTDWSLYLSRRSGYHFAEVYKAPADPATRWIVVREPHVGGRWPYTSVIRDLIGDREPVALIPTRPAPGQLQIRIYDRQQAESAPAIGQTGELSSNTARKL
jgi:hypothetical protein